MESIWYIDFNFCFYCCYFMYDVEGIIIILFCRLLFEVFLVCVIIEGRIFDF